MKKNWKSEKKFAAKGVNGTVCSILEYLSHVSEIFCFLKIVLVARKLPFKVSAYENNLSKILFLLFFSFRFKGITR